MEDPTIKKHTSLQFTIARWLFQLINNYICTNRVIAYTEQYRRSTDINITAQWSKTMQWPKKQKTVVHISNQSWIPSYSIGLIGLVIYSASLVYPPSFPLFLVTIGILVHQFGISTIYKLHCKRFQFCPCQITKIIFSLLVNYWSHKIFFNDMFKTQFFGGMIESNFSS